MEGMKEPNLREKFASLLVLARLGVLLDDDIQELLTDAVDKDVQVPLFRGNTSAHYKKYLSTIGDTSTLFALLSTEREKGNEKWILPIIIKRIVEVLDKDKDDHIFDGDIDKAIIYIYDPYQKRTPQNKYLSPLAIKLDSTSSSLSVYPFSFFTPCQCNEERKAEVLYQLGRLFNNSSDFYSIKEPTWVVLILDTKGSYFTFHGIGKLYPFYSTFSIPLIPRIIEIQDLTQKDEFTSLSMKYSRLSFDGDEEILESLTLGRKEGIVRLERHSNDLDFQITMKDKSTFLDELFSDINVYSFYPKCIDTGDKKQIDMSQPYYRTRYSLSYETLFGRKELFNGFFTSYDLPKGWKEISKELRSKVDSLKKMESVDPSLVSMGRTTYDTVFACKVVFSSYSKEYLYIAPDGTYYPGMKVMVPAGTKNAIQIVTIKSLHALSKEKDAELIKKCKTIISHYPNKN